MRNFAVIGLSNFGYFLAKELTNKSLYVLAVDVDEERINQVKPFVQKAIIADATDKDTLGRLGLSEIDAVVVSLGDRIDASILATLYLKELGIKEIVVKAVSEDHGKVLEMVGATRIVFPERDTARHLAYSLSALDVLDHLELAPGYSIIDFVPPAAFENKTLAQLDLRKRYQVQVIVVKQLVPERVIFPAADYVVRSSDILVVMGEDEDLRKFQALSH